MLEQIAVWYLLPSKNTTLSSITWQKIVVTFTILSNMGSRIAGPSSRAVQGVGLRPLVCWDCGFESHRRHGCLLVVSVVFFSGRGLCDELITHPEESYLLWCVAVCDLETSRMRRPWPALGRSATENTFHVPRLCSTLAWWWLFYSWNMSPRILLTILLCYLWYCCVLYGNKYHSIITAVAQWLRCRATNL